MLTFKSFLREHYLIEATAKHFNHIPKEPAIAPKDPVVPTNQDLMDKVMSNFDKNPQIATKVQ